MNITCKEAEELLVLLILDGKLAGKIDQVSQIMELDQRYLIALVLKQFTTN